MYRVVTIQPFGCQTTINFNSIHNLMVKNCGLSTKNGLQPKSYHKILEACQTSRKNFTTQTADNLLNYLAHKRTDPKT